MTHDVAAIAAALTAARAGGDPVSPHAPPPDLATAYAVQAAVAAAHGGIAGWKGGPADPAAARASPILAGQVRPSPARFAGAAMRIIGVEAEIAFVMARGFAAGPAPGADAVLDAVAAAHVAIEVCDTRIEPWRDADPLWKLADCQSNLGLVLGDAIPGWRTHDFAAQHARLHADGALIGGRDDLPPSGDPRSVLVAVVQHLVERREGIRPGAAVTTGSWTGMPLVSPGAKVVAQFAGLGTALVEF
jgi:2-keto-4-pentenoate hydratase